MVMAGVETKSKMGRVDLSQKGLQRIRIFLKNIFDGNAQPRLLRLLHQRFPGLKTAFEP